MVIRISALCRVLFAFSCLFGSDIQNLFRAVVASSAQIGTCPLRNHNRDQHGLHFQDRASCPVPVDEHSRPERWGLWDYRPYCVNATTKPVIKYCVYSYPEYGHYGLSMITRPEVAASSVEILQDAAERILSYVNETVAPPYRIEKVPGKGMGVIANRLIRRHEMIMVDHASIIVDAAFPGRVKQADGQTLLHVAVDQLSDPESVLNMGRSSTDDHADIMEDVLITNSYKSDWVGMPHMLLVPEISRFNHACKPNAFLRYSTDNLIIAAVANRDIQPGEELTISYISPGHTRAERQKHLRRWGFSCTCELCSGPKEEVEASDARRKKITELRVTTLEFLKKGKAYSAIKAIKDTLDLLAEEGLELMAVEQYESLARIYWAMENREMAETYAQMSLDVLKEYTHLDQKRDTKGDLEALLASFG